MNHWFNKPLYGSQVIEPQSSIIWGFLSRAFTVEIFFNMKKRLFYVQFFCGSHIKHLIKCIGYKTLSFLLFKYIQIIS